MTIDNRRGAKMYPIMSGEKKGASAALTRAALAALSGVYKSAYEKRMARLQKKEKARIDAPVISIGNITVGGTGKTPVCLYLAREFAARGRKVGIATRGYGREGGGTVLLNDGNEAKSWHNCGDEPMLFAADPAVHAVGVDINRALAAKELVDKAGCDIVLLDDGFQFITLHRDIDILVFDAGNPFGYEKLLPAGLLREPLSSIARADVFWLAKTDSVSVKQKNEIVGRLAKEQPYKPIVESHYEPAGFAVYRQSEIISADSIESSKALCISGIGNPEPFERLIGKLSGTPPLAVRFEDHHPFGDGELARVEDEAIRAGMDFIVTTEKDAARLPGHFKPRCKWLVTKIDVKVTNGADVVERILTLPENLFRR